MTNWIHQIGCDCENTDYCKHEMRKAKGNFEDMLYCGICGDGCQCRFIREGYERGLADAIKAIQEIGEKS
jgi:hypothetical protein